MFSLLLFLFSCFGGGFGISTQLFCVMCKEVRIPVSLISLKGNVTRAKLRCSQEEGQKSSSSVTAELKRKSYPAMPFIKVENLLCQVRLECRHLLGSKYTYKATMTTPVFLIW